jgi:hypothetical protein
MLLPRLSVMKSCSFSSGENLGLIWRKLSCVFFGADGWSNRYLRFAYAESKTRFGIDGRATHGDGNSNKVGLLT